MPGSRLRIEHSISKGYYCEINNHQYITDEQIAQIRSKMLEIVRDDIPFVKKMVYRSEAIRIFKDRGLHDKVDLLETVGTLYTEVYSLGDHWDFFYGSLLPSTGLLKVFDLERFFDGLILRVPQRKNPYELEEFSEQPKMMSVLNEFTKFNAIAGLSNVGSMNKIINKGHFMPLIQVSEALQEKKIASIADDIAKRKDLKLVLIAGPSSSGKTTFSKRLSVQLMTNLIIPVAISLDNYFVERVNTPLDENGEYDFESLYSLDLDLFNDHLNKLIAGEEIDLPTYNFEKGIREYKGKKVKLNLNSIFIIEVIHGLNPELTSHIEEYYKYRI